MSRNRQPRNSALRSAVVLYKQGWYDQARDLARLTLEQVPHDGKLWELCGLCHDACGEVGEAMHALETATTLVPLSAAGQCVLAKCYVAAGHRELARQMYRFVFAREGLPGKLLPILAAGLGSVGDCEFALQACRRAAELELDSGQPLYGMAYYMERLGYPLEMIASILRRAVDIEPDAFQYRYALATVCDRLGHREEAYRVLRPVVRPDLLQGIRCVSCLSRMEGIFASAGEGELTRACRARIWELKTAW